MIDFVKQLIQQHFVLLFVTAAVLLALALAALVYLFRKFSGSRDEAESARRAVELELSLLGRLGRLFRRRTDVVVAGTTEDPNALTISKPIPAVPPPKS